LILYFSLYFYFQYIYYINKKRGYLKFLKATAKRLKKRKNKRKNKKNLV